MNRSLIALSLILPLLSACSTLVYEEPQSGARARVRFTSDLDSIAVLRVYDDARCASGEAEWLRLKNGSLIRSTPKRLGMPLWAYNDNAAKEVYVATDKPLHALISASELAGPMTFSCGVPFSYAFQPDQDYEVSFRWMQSSCQVEIKQLVPKPNGVEAQPLQTFDNRVTDANRSCLDAFKKGRLY